MKQHLKNFAIVLAAYAVVIVAVSLPTWIIK